MQLLHEGRDSWWNDRVEDHLGAARHDRFDGPAVVGVIEGKVLLADDLAPVGGDQFTDLLVHDVRPNVVRGRQIELLRPGLLHQPRNRRLELLRGHRAGAEDERIAFLPLVLLRVDVESPPLLDGRALDRLPGGAVDATEDHVHVVLLYELGGPGPGHTVGRRTVLEAQLEPPPQQAPVALMSWMTMLATFALAMPMTESGPVRSVTTPTLMDTSLIARSPLVSSRPASNLARVSRREGAPY